MPKTMTKAPLVTMGRWFDRLTQSVLDAIDFQGRNRAHRAIASNDISTLVQMKQTQPELLFQIDAERNDIVMIALAEHAIESWFWLHEQADLQALLSAPKQQQLTAYHLLASGRSPVLLDRFLTWAQTHDDKLTGLKSVLMDTLHQIHTETDIELLLTYKTIWQRMLLSEGLYTDIDIDDTLLSGPHVETLRGLLQKTKALQAIKRIDVTQGTAKSIFMTLQQVLVDVASQYVPYAHRLKAPSSMLQALPFITAGFDHDELTQDDMTILHELIDSYRAGGLEQRNSLSDAVMSTLINLLQYKMASQLKFCMHAEETSSLIAFLSDIPNFDDDGTIKRGFDKLTNNPSKKRNIAAYYSSSEQDYPDLSNLASGARLILLGHGHVDTSIPARGYFNDWSAQTLTEHLFIDCSLGLNRNKHISVMVLLACNLAQTNFAQCLQRELALCGVNIGRIDCFDAPIRMVRSGRYLGGSANRSGLLYRHGIFGEPSTNILTPSTQALSFDDMIASSSDEASTPTTDIPTISSF